MSVEMSMQTTQHGIVGNAAAIRTMEAVLIGPNAVHALLLIGPDSVGKSHAVEQYIQDAECLRYDSTISLNDVRTIRSLCATVPPQGRRVVVCTHVDTWSKEVANAMLKLLEEPRAGTTIVLTASVRNRVLPTIQSRCVEILFTRVSQEPMRALYQQLHLPNDDRMQLRLMYADGRPGRLIAYAQSKEMHTQWNQAEQIYNTIQTGSLAEGFAIAKTLGASSKKRPTALIREEFIRYIALWEAQARQDAQLSSQQRRRWMSGLVQLQGFIEANVHPQRAFEWFVIEQKRT